MNIKTYGEACIAEQFSLTMKNGKFIQTIHIKNKPKKMSREETALYYNTKIYNYYLDILNKEKPARKKLNEIWLKIKMFGLPENAKLLKD